MVYAITHTYARGTQGRLYLGALSNKSIYNTADNSTVRESTLSIKLNYYLNEHKSIYLNENKIEFNKQ